jgi:hypothetical protein
VLHRSKHKCEACGFDYGHGRILRSHHVRPVSKDGKSDADNLVALCPNCHAVVHVLRPGSKSERKRRMYYVTVETILKTFDAQRAALLLGLGDGSAYIYHGRWYPARDAAYYTKFVQDERTAEQARSNAIIKAMKNGH